ncbi:hypothetical protein ES703_84285 [subsurface metagenome]
MGKTKLRRILEDTLVKVVREVSKVVNTIPEECKFCGSKRIVRYGHYQGVQHWWCKDCKRKFVHNEALGDKTPAQKAGIKFPFRDWLDIVKGANK